MVDCPKKNGHATVEAEERNSAQKQNYLTVNGIGNVSFLLYKHLYTDITTVVAYKPLI